eukprot:GHVS01105435.1.p1 GENE.GHVS01105435.1~~GHVS01105435.1.p1  ORF type:complete len:206 (+),score=30.34 GHVS01105435.1:109-726(+)
MGLMEYNGSAVVGMAGKNCVGIACDKRLGINRFQTVSADFQKSFKITDKCFVGLAGLATDVQTVSKYLKFRTNLYELREERAMPAAVVSNLIGSVLYSRRFAPYFVAPVVAGLDEKNEPVLAAFDFIGADCKAKDFVVNGTASEQLYGVCESFWKPDMDEEQLFETLSQCLLAGVDRDCVSGWGGVVHIITPTRIISRSLKGRQD